MTRLRIFFASHSIYGGFISHRGVKNLLAIDSTFPWSSYRFNWDLNWNNKFLTFLGRSMPALDSPEAIQRGASLCLFILGCRTFARSLEDCSNAKIVGDPKVSDCLSINIYFMEM